MCSRFAKLRKAHEGQHNGWQKKWRVDDHQDSSHDIDDGARQGEAAAVHAPADGIEQHGNTGGDHLWQQQGSANQGVQLVAGFLSDGGTLAEVLIC